jgi:hypothetical protein
MRSNRREFFKVVGVGAAGLTLGAASASVHAASATALPAAVDDGPVLLVGDNIAVTDTAYGEGLTAWPRYTPARGETMILDDVCEVKNDPDREARKALPAL